MSETLNLTLQEREVIAKQLVEDANSKDLFMEDRKWIYELKHRANFLEKETLEDIYYSELLEEFVF
jgi:hypothetical protein